MSRIAIIVITIFITLSSSFLTYIMISTWFSVSIVTHIRLIVFLIQHFYTASMLILFFLKEQQMEGIMWLLWFIYLTSVNTILFISTEIFAFLKNKSMTHYKTTVTEHQVYIIGAYLTFYFQLATYFAMFMVISIVGYIIIMVRNRNSEHQYDEVIAQLRTIDYESNHNDNQQRGVCSICLVQLHMEKVCQLPCDHYFHKQCLLSWLKESLVCPLCRFVLHPRMYDNDSNE